MGMKIFDDLNRDWSRSMAARQAAERVAGWSKLEGPLASLDGLEKVVGVAHGADRERADDVLAALLRIGKDDQLAWTTVLHVVMPGLVCIARRFVPGPASEREVASTVVAVAWRRIAEYPLERRPRSIAVNIVLDTRQISSSILFRHAQAEVPSVELTEMQGARSEHEDPSVVLLRLLQDAVKDDVLSLDDARLVALTRIWDVRVEDVAAERGVLPHSLRRRRLRAEAALSAALR